MQYGKMVWQTLVAFSVEIMSCSKLSKDFIQELYGGIRRNETPYCAATSQSTGLHLQLKFMHWPKSYQISSILMKE
jgi:hypothetical protein